MIREMIAFHDEVLPVLEDLAGDRVATFQELADEAFDDLLRKYTAGRITGKSEDERAVELRRKEVSQTQRTRPHFGSSIDHTIPHQFRSMLRSSCYPVALLTKGAAFVERLKGGVGL